MATRVRSYSKINLGLAIGPVRADGFHGLATLYQTLALHDVVSVEVKATSQNRDVGHPDFGTTKITLTTNDARVPTDARNTAWTMVELTLQRMGIAAEVAIHIEKELPVQGGMGAGSANAAAALIGLERELGRALPEADRLELAAEVGSDVPLFLIGGTVLGEGRGEIVSAMATDLPATWCVVAVPEVGVSTPRAFRDWDALWAGSEEEPTSQKRDGGHPHPDFSIAERAGLTRDPQSDRLEQLSHAYASVLGNQPEQAPDTSGIVRGPTPESKQVGFEEQSSSQGKTLSGLAGNALLALVRTGIENDFEQVVFPQYPLLREIKRLLMGTSAGLSSDSPADSSGNAVYAALSGSGSALFGLYGSEQDARAAQRRVQASGCKAILTETLARQEYWSSMFAE
jgi:4-diphosphocytidyl-2-C-methyl-D-erythritol kinase